MKLYGSFDNYIEMYRKRVGLSQAELGLLLSVEQRASVSRYERGTRFPDLRGLIALEMILGQPIQGLFAGISERVREDVTSRSRTLLESLSDDRLNKEYAAKLDILGKLARPDEPRLVPTWEA